MNKPYAMMIDEEIAVLQRRIDELLTTQRILAEFAKREERTKVLTLTDTRPKVSHKKKLPEDLMRKAPPISRSAIIDVLAAMTEPVNSSVIIEKLIENGVPVTNKQRVWTVLSTMKSYGEIYHNVDERTYSLRQPSSTKDESHDDATQTG